MAEQNLIHVAAGMGHLHSQGLIHRDLAARNVLLDVVLRAKVSDFGLSKMVGSQSMTSLNDVLPLKWLAPEVFSTGQYSCATDVWSYGILCLEVLTQDNPYPDVPVNKFVVSFQKGLRPHKCI